MLQIIIFTKMPWYMEVITGLFTEIKSLSLAFEKQPNTIIPCASKLHDTMHLGKDCSYGKWKTQTWITRHRSMTSLFREHSLEFSRDVFYTDRPQPFWHHEVIHTIKPHISHNFCNMRYLKTCGTHQFFLDLLILDVKIGSTAST